MKSAHAAALVLALSIGATIPALAQAPRQDFIWARSTNGAAITLDGVLNEPAWAQAESVVVRMAQDTGIPGSGWFYESGVAPIDPTYATIRFLRVGNQLYMGAYVRDHSIGGSDLFNRFDGLLMSIKDHLSVPRPALPTEYLYSWWNPDNPGAAVAPGAMPTFRGRWTGCYDPISNCPRPRTAAEIAAWDAVTTVGGITNDDNNVDGDPNDNDDWGYVIEMRFDLTVMGYDMNQPAGDTVEWNVSIYDCDWLWPFQALFSANRVWWQNPWGNDAWFHNVRVMGKPSVTIISGPAPALGPDFRVPAADNYAAPTMDGFLTDPVWQDAPHLDIRYDDPALRNTYPGEGPWRSGQVQFSVNGNLATVLDPGDATIKWFYKGDKLYLGFDVRDQIVQYYSLESRWDGFIVSVNDYAARSTANHNLVGYKYSFQVGPTGAALAQAELPPLISSGGAQLALKLKAPSPLDTLDRTASDVGYTAEMWIDLTRIGYPVGRGDGRLFLSIDLLDGDSFTNWTDSYGARVWWQREHAGGSGASGGGKDGPAWGYLDPGMQVVAVEGQEPVPATRIALLGTRPNPSGGKTALYFTLPRPGDVTVEVFDLSGRRVARRDYGRQPAGASHVIFADERLDSGMYMYRVRVSDDTGSAPVTLTGKMILVR